MPRTGSRPGKGWNTALLGVAALVLMAVVGLSYREWRQYSRANADAAQTRALVDSIDRLLASLIDAETAQRGFLLTGEDRYLDPYNRAIQEIPAELSAVSRLLAARSRQAGDATRLRNLTEDKLAELRETVELRRTRGSALPLDIALIDRGKQTMDAIRAICVRIHQTELSSQSQASTEGEAAAGTALLATVVGSLLLLFLFAFGLEPFASPEPRAWQRSWPTRYGAGVSAVVAIALLRGALTPLIGRTNLPFTLFFFAVAFTAWFGGFRPAVLSIILSLLAGSYFFAAPTRSLYVSGRDDQVAMLMIVVVGFAVALLSRSQRGAVERAVRAENSERNERQHFETTLASIGDAVIATDAQGRVTFANHVALDLLRRPEGEVTGKPLDEVFPIVNEFTRAAVDSPVARVLREGALAGLANHTVLIAADGTEVPIDDSAAPIRTADGVMQGAVLVFRDITERRRAERNAAYLEAIVESSDYAIIGKSLTGTVESWNAGAERLYGYTADEMIGRPVNVLMPPDRLHEESEILKQIWEGTGVSHRETLRRRKDGTLVEVSLAISPVRDKAGQIIGASHVARDITEDKRNAESLRQTQKLESLGILAGGIAHDFNNLLVGMLGNASLALDDLPADTPVRRAVEDVIVAAERAAQLTRQMLAYSGKGRFVLEHMDLSARVRETVPLIRAAIPRTVQLQMDLADGLPAIEADAAEIQQLLMNIVINGAEAIPEEQPGMVVISTGRQQVDEEYARTHAGAESGDLQPGPYVMLEVRDTGSGMDEATKAKIFDPFFTTKFTGRGLGLAAVLGIVRGHGGSIHVASSPGQGSTFRILLPALEKPVESHSLLERQETDDLYGRGTVLVIDDEEIVRKVARQALERYGYTVLLGEDGKSGIEVFSRDADRIACVVLDLTMPVMSGEETLGRIRAVRPRVPVILSSGFNEVEAVRRFRGKGLAGFLQKPYQATILVKRVKQVIGEAIAAGAP